ncbi:MAG: hypothetical protein WED07_14490 [Candidatus Freyarchaeum deiterrae]
MYPSDEGESYLFLRLLYLFPWKKRVSDILGLSIRDYKRVERLKAINADANSSKHNESDIPRTNLVEL